MSVSFRSGGIATVIPFGFPTPDMWLDATKITGIANGATLQTWVDISGHDNDAAQATAGYRPTYHTSAINGLPAVLFNSTTVLNMELDISRNLYGASIFLIFRNLTATNQTRLLYYTSINSSAGSRIVMYRNDINITKLDCGARATDAGDFVTISSDADTLLDANDYLLEQMCDFENGSMKLYIDGSIIDTESLASSGHTDDTNSNLACIGNTVSPTANNSAYGYIGEVLCYKRYLADFERENVENYLMNKWGVS